MAPQNHESASLIQHWRKKRGPKPPESQHFLPLGAGGTIPLFAIPPSRAAAISFACLHALHDHLSRDSPVRCPPVNWMLSLNLACSMKSIMPTRMAQGFSEIA
jgi:hypothetical protein